MKIQRKINIRDEVQLQDYLAKSGCLEKFGQGDFKSVSALYSDLERGDSWLEFEETGKLLRVMEMLGGSCQFLMLLVLSLLINMF